MGSIWEYICPHDDLLSSTFHWLNELFTHLSDTMKSKLLLSSLALLFMFILSLYQANAQVPEPIGVVPVLRINGLKTTEVDPMKLTELSVDIRIVGQVAITTLDMTWFNRNNRVMEGEFTFPLGEGQTVSGFAIDIGGRLRDGVVVEKEQGRKVFEAIVRRNVDPGLLEMTAGNHYRSRIYPLPAKGSRRIVIAYEQELTDLGNYDLYALPLNLKEAVDNFRLHIEVVKKQACIPDSSNELTNLSFARWEESWVSNLEFKDFTPDKQIAFSLPHNPATGEVVEAMVKKPVRSLLVPGFILLFLALSFSALLFVLFRKGRLPKKLLAALVLIPLLLLSASLVLIFRNRTPEIIIQKNSNQVITYSAPVRPESDSSWFYITIRPTIFTQPKKVPQTITVLWDNSHSALNRNLKKEADLLLKYVRSLANVKVDLIPFNIATEAPVHFSIQRGNINALQQALDSIQYDGATSLGNLSLDKYASDEIIIFSDGISNYGHSLPEISANLVFTINSGVSADHNRLRFIAQRNGGVYINLNKLTGGEALKSLERNDYHFISAEVVQGEAAEMYPASPASFQHTFTLAGKMPGDFLKLKLNFGFGNTIKHTELVEIKGGEKNDPALLRRVWAHKKIEELSSDPETNKKLITATGKEFGIVTPYTSLIVLEELSDYLEYNIVPPKEMQKDFFKTVRADQKMEKIAKGERIQKVLEMADAQTEWWKTKFLESYRKQENRVDDELPVAEEPVESPVAPEPSPVVTANANVAVADSIHVQGLGYTVVSNASYTWDATAVSGAATQFSPGAYTFTTMNGLSTQVTDMEEVSHSGGISIEAWNPETPYLKVLQKAKKGDRKATYFRLKKKYANMPGFYPDVAGFFRKAGDTTAALRILSNLAELNLESPQLLRIFGVKLMDFGQFSEAADVFGKVLTFKGEDPQSYRDLGLALEASGEYDKAVKALYEVLIKDWDQRFPEIEMIALNDINGILSRHPKTDHSYIDKRLVRKEPVDVRVVMTWDSDNCDMDLWVTDPHGEKCYYSNNLTALGGKISRDFTGGYGPEEFMLRKAVAGEYLIEANYYGTSSQSELGPVSLHLVFYTHYGKSNQKRMETTVRLDDRGGEVTVGRFRFGK